MGKEKRGVGTVRVLLLTTNGLVGMDCALWELLGADAFFVVRVADWRSRKWKALRKNGLVFAFRKYCWLKDQEKIGDMVRVAPFKARLVQTALKDEYRTFDCDVLVSFGWDKRIPMEFCDKFGVAVNVHPSMLPKYRGWNPIKRAFDAGDDGGVSVHRIGEEFDKGEVLMQRAVSYQGKDLKQCYIDTMEEAGKMVKEFLDGVGDRIKQQGSINHPCAVFPSNDRDARG